MRSEDTFYYFSETPDYFVISGKVKLGYPLIALFVPRINRLLAWEECRRFRAVLKALREIADINTDNTLPATKIMPLAIMGHPNFAHHLWNELSALETLINKNPSLAPEIVTVREPLGPIARIFPDIGKWNVQRAPKRTSGNDPGKPYVQLGGFRVSTSLKTRIVRHANAFATADTQALANRLSQWAAPIFWLSVRTQVPTFEKQRDVLVSLALKLRREHPDCAILFDGFSLPRDWKTSDHKMKTFYESAAEESKAEIDATISELLRLDPANSSLFNLGGLGLLDSITLAQLAHMYFCHKGTIQHKIGWTANVPGIIHGPRWFLTAETEEWYTSRAESSVRPLALDPSLIVDTSEQKQSNYRAIDCELYDSGISRIASRYLSLAFTVGIALFVATFAMSTLVLSPMFLT
ncbi:MAG TPA: hypothetical protein VMD76_09740 [Candidatus Sulfotelmatobacter sp.]|nr:hypothetical protein [Candidatus Sulfotelmatobacter sp.]